MSAQSRTQHLTYALISSALAVTVLAGCTGSAGAKGTAHAEPEPAAVCENNIISEDDTTRTVKTAFGNVTIPKNPEKVIGLEGGTGPVLEADLTPVATADNYEESYLPSEYAVVQDLPVVLSPDGWDFEKIASLQPDLMVGFIRGGTEEKLSEEKTREWERLNSIAPTLLFRSNGSGSTKDVSCAIEVALGTESKAVASKTAYEKKAQEIKEKYADVLSTHTFVALDAYEDVSVFSPLSWIGDILADAGVNTLPIAQNETKENAAFLSFEELTQVNDADVVLYSKTVDGQLDLGAQDLQNQPTYNELAAVKKGNAYGITYFFADRYSTGLIALESLEDVLEDLTLKAAKSQP
ncbi:ABC transporter substrate-binding protein [Timonella sp. A28]|uniref:ABC transporter substrate-binding protein n=1 Tax=Timonella sp. A28 TaxID=3442640 RepID=UPI003EBF5A84